MSPFRLTLVALAVFSASASAFASAGDLKTFERVRALGFASETIHGQTFVGLDTIACFYSRMTHESECAVRDVAASGGEGAQVTLTGARAAGLIDLLVDMNAPTENGADRFYVTAQEIRCRQTLPGLDDAGAAERTNCSIDLAE